MAGHAVTPVACVAMVVGGYRGGEAENKGQAMHSASIRPITINVEQFRHLSGLFKMNPR
jgi:hypothetical protein